jgi:hypothetical protein
MWTPAARATASSIISRRFRASGSTHCLNSPTVLSGASSPAELSMMAALWLELMNRPTGV